MAQWTQPLVQSLDSLSRQLPLLLPELILGLGITLLVVLDALAPKRQGLRTGLVVAILTGLLGGLAWQGVQPPGVLPVSFFFFDHNAVLLKVLSVILTVLILPSWLRVPALNQGGEGLIFLLGLLFGAFITLSARHLLALFLGIEVLSLSAYLLTAYVRTDLRATEATIKYLIFGSVSSGLMLYGASLLYGLTGSLFIATDDFGATLAQRPLWPALIGLVLVAGGLFYKISAAPFHFYVPDVFEAVSPPLVALFGTVPKIAATLALARLMYILPADSTLQLYFGIVVGGWAALSLVIGNTGALGQTSFLRLLAYSSIAHSGFALLPLAVGDAEGLAAAVNYQALLSFVTFGAVMTAHWLMTQHGDDKLTSWQGQGRNSWVGGAMAVLLLGLTGLPPTVGFWVKLSAFLPLTAGFGDGPVLYAVLFVLGLLATVVALAVYFRVVAVLLFQSAPAPMVSTQQIRPETTLKLLALLGAALTLGLGLTGTGFVQDALRSGFAR